MWAALALILAQNFGVPTGPIFSTPSMRAAPNYAFFELAPASGAGMGAACAGTAIAGAKGEAVTWNRAGSAYCTKEGAATTGLTTTSMVLIGSNAPRVEANGKGGVGLRYERDRTNRTLWSEDITNAAWSLFGPGTRTANQGIAPNGATTADRLTTTGAAGTQAVCQNTGAAPGLNYGSVYLRARSGTPTIYCYAYEGAGTPNANTAVTLNTSTFSRCVVPLTAGAGAITFCVGYDTTIGMSAQTVDIDVWGEQIEDTTLGGPLVSSYIPTTTAAVTRATDAPPTYAGVTLTGFASAGSSAATVTPLGTGQTSGAALVAMANLGRALYFNNTLRMYDGTVELALAANHQTGVPRRYWSSWAGATQTLANATDATSTSGAFDGAMDVGGPLQIGSDTWVGTISNFILSEICLDPDSTRCR